MNFKSPVRCWMALALVALSFVPLQEVSAQQDKVAALKRSLTHNQNPVRATQCVETAATNVKGEEQGRPSSIPTDPAGNSKPLKETTG